MTRPGWRTIRQRTGWWRVMVQARRRAGVLTTRRVSAKRVLAALARAGVR